MPFDGGHIARGAAVQPALRDGQCIPGCRGHRPDLPGHDGQRARCFLYLGIFLLIGNTHHVQDQQDRRGDSAEGPYPRPAAYRPRRARGVITIDAHGYDSAGTNEPVFGGRRLRRRAIPGNRANGSAPRQPGTVPATTAAPAGKTTRSPRRSRKPSSTDWYRRFPQGQNRRSSSRT